MDLGNPLYFRQKNRTCGCIYKQSGNSDYISYSKQASIFFMESETVLTIGGLFRFP